MAEQLAYAFITPHSLAKSRTGGILARLVTRTGLELAAARMFAPSAALAEEYAQAVVSAQDPQDTKIQELIRDYVRQQFAPEAKTGRRRRVMALLFRGKDAVRKVRAVVGNVIANRHGGETIRDTYGDLILDESGQMRYFEPAVLAAHHNDEAAPKLKLWARYSDTDGGLLENTIEYQPDDRPERTLVLIKPDNFRFPSGRPGNMIDLFSRTGLYILAIRVLHFSVGEAMEFYGPVREVLRTQLKDMVGARAKAALEKEFGFPMPSDTGLRLGDLLGPVCGDAQFENIVRFMSGRAPRECDPVLRQQPGTEQCIALVYEGPGAVSKIRSVLGPTDPAKAPPGSIRREFGSSVMVNAGHASDSVESAEREIAIVKPGENHFRQVVEEFYGQV
jgi:nucleoside diphosphate kinase